jgi:hypothetical protein
MDTVWHAPEAGASVIDIGAGFGHVLFAVREGWPDARLYAVEPDSTCHPFLRSIGAEIVVREDYSAPIRLPERVDLVLLTHVLEHLLRPTDDLRRLSRLMSARGVMLLEVPNCPRGLEALWDTVPHISFFDEASLGACVRAAGGRILKMETCGPEYERPTWRRWVPKGFKRLARRALTRLRPSTSVDTTADPETWRDATVIPDHRFAEYGGDRAWIRALIRFEGT